MRGRSGLLAPRKGAPSPGSEGALPQGSPGRPLVTSALLGPGVPAEVWSVIASPFLPKYLSSPRCAALQGALYLVGDNTKKVYVYDPGANLWQKVGLASASPPQGTPPGPLTTGGRGEGSEGRREPGRGPGARQSQGRGGRGHRGP